MKSYIWDTGPLTLYFSDHLRVRKLMENCLKENIGSVPMIVLVEFQYLQWRHNGRRIAHMRTDSIRYSGLEILDLQYENVFQAAQFKVTHNQLSLVDSILLSLSQKNRSTIITTEEYLHSLKNSNSIKIDF